MPPTETARLPIDIPRQAGAHVRQTREEQGLTRAQLAQRAGVSERLLASLELGDAPGIRLDKLLSILHALGLSLVVLNTAEHPGRQKEPATPQGGRGESPRQAAVSDEMAADNGTGRNAHQGIEEKLAGASEGLLYAYERTLNDLICQSFEAEKGQR